MTYTRTFTLPELAAKRLIDGDSIEVRDGAGYATVRVRQLIRSGNPDVNELPSFTMITYTAEGRPIAVALDGKTEVRW